MDVIASGIRERKAQLHLATDCKGGPGYYTIRETAAVLTCTQPSQFSS